MAGIKGPGLYEFLIEAELQQYYSGLKNDLKVQYAAHLKYVAESDLEQLGMSKPEIRRMRKYFLKHFPQNYFAKFKKLILSKDGKDNWELMIPEEPGQETKSPIRVPNKHIIPADTILVNKQLGTGEFGVVQQGVWTNDGERIQVAIKCLSRERMQNNPIEFLKEASIMHSIDHEHIVRLYGVVLDTDALMLVTELAPLRSLLECLKEPSLRSSFPVLTLCDFSIQICDGMQYLEAKRLIHRDLAARNILVFSKNKVKISDFGLSRALGVGKDYYQTNFNVNLKLPIAWCAPECISYLRFTSASDVWAYGVTLWEMFSYGFQPWAALTGHQILETIDEPNFQRLEQPECCPKEYYNLMLKCWQHDANRRPRFSDLINILPECKPEQVQAIQDSTSDERARRDQLSYHVGDIITVLHKTPMGSSNSIWKGVLNNGKSGLFNPAHTVTYLGSNLPSSRNSDFARSTIHPAADGKLYSSKRCRIRPEMISCPQNDLKHTGHVGLDGAYFGDISFLGTATKYNHLPHQIVTPYKPQEDSTNSTEPSTPAKMCSDRAPLISPDKHKSHSDSIWMDYESIKAASASKSSSGAPSIQNNSKQPLTDHEYHEISNEDPVNDSPRFEKSFDFGPSLLDEMDAMFRTLGSEVNNSMIAGIRNYASSPPPSPLDVDTNKHNELREIAAMTLHSKGKKKQPALKPISAGDDKTLEVALAMANEIAARSMNDVQGALPESPVTPISPNKRKFSFRFPTPSVTSSRTEGKTFSDEAASIPADIQGCLSEEARAAYNTLVDEPATVCSAAMITQPPVAMETANPLKLLKSNPPIVRAKIRAGPTIHTNSATDIQQSSINKNSSHLHRCSNDDADQIDPELVSNVGTNGATGLNAIPLPPRDRTKLSNVAKPRHQRKHPLIIPIQGKRVSGGVSVHPVATGDKLDLNSEITAQPSFDCVDGPSSLGKSACRLADEERNADDSFDQKIACDLAALDNLEMEEHFLCNANDESNNENNEKLSAGIENVDAGPSALSRSDDHVSCEDLLDFACDGPNAKRKTQGRSRGAESDEVRIMEKVLGPKVSGEMCVSALNVTDWDVHRAIKLARLESLLLNSNPNTRCITDSITNIAALETMNWDVSEAANLIIANLKLD